MLGIAISKITGIPLQTLFDKSLIEPLGLSGTSYTVPDKITDHDVIPGNPLTVGWTSNFGPFAGYASFRVLTAQVDADDFQCWRLLFNNQRFRKDRQSYLEFPTALKSADESMDEADELR